MNRPQSPEENELYAQFLMAIVPAVIEMSHVRNCITGSCYDSHDHSEEVRKVSYWSSAIALYLLDDYRQVRFDTPAPLAMTRTRKVAKRDEGRTERQQRALRRG